MADSWAEDACMHTASGATGAPPMRSTHMSMPAGSLHGACHRCASTWLVENKSLPHLEKMGQALQDHHGHHVLRCAPCCAACTNGLCTSTYLAQPPQRQCLSMYQLPVVSEIMWCCVLVGLEVGWVSDGG
jgi:hypothetical protein